MRASGRRFAGLVPALLSYAVLILLTVAVAAPARAGGSGPNGGHPCPPAGNPTCGDPITIGSGNVFEEVTDYETAGPNKLALIRYYNSANAENFFATFWPWRSNYDSFIHLPGGACTPCDVIMPDNKNFHFNGVGPGTGPSNINARLELQCDVTCIYTLVDWNDTVWTYGRVESLFATDDIRRLTSITYRNGYTQMLQYSPCRVGCTNGVPASVTDSYGRTLTFGPIPGLIWFINGSDLRGSVVTPDGLMINYNYDSRPRLSGVAYPTSPPSTTTYLYEDPRFAYALTGIIDENGNRFATLTYDSSGRATSRQNAGGANLTTVVYNVDGSRLVTNALGQQELYKFTQFNTGTPDSIPINTEIDRLATAMTSAAQRLFTYDANGNLASEADWNGNKTTYINDARGRPVTVTEAVGTLQQRVTQITWHSTFNVPTEIVEPGLTTDLTYDANGKLLTRTETDTASGQARTWTYSWGANFLLASAADPRGNTTQFGYDASGALTSMTNALGQVTQITQHTGGGLPQTIVDPNGVTTILTYDARQRLVTRTINTAGGPLTTTYTHDAAGNLISVTLPDSASITSTYDAAHRLVAVADLFNQRITYTLDGLGNRTQTTVLDGSGTVTRTESASFDALGRRVTGVGGVGQTTSYTYDSNGNLTTITDPLGRVTAQTFDALNRRVRITDPATGITAIAYDAHDRPVSVADPNGNTTSYAYDGFGNPVQMTSPDTGTATYGFDPAGNVVQRTDAAGAVTNYAYDALDRPISASYPANPTENVQYRYDEAGGGFGIGRLTSVVDPAGSLSRVYDEQGNLLGETRNHAGATVATAYTYDAASRITAITYPSGWTASYSRDAMGRIAAIAAAGPGSAGGTPVISSIGYQPFGPVSGFTYGNGVAETRVFDQDYRETGLNAAGASPLQGLSYGYDAADNVLSIADTVTTGNSQNFAYDALNRLTSAAGSYGTINYGYDPVGNLLTLMLGDGTTQNFSYASGTNRLTAVNSGGTPVRQFSFTATGNVAQDTQPTQTIGLSYNNGNRLATVTPGSSSWQYTYDGSGQRMLKSPAGMATETLYQYDLGGRLVEESGVSGGSAAAQLDYIYLDDKPVALLVPSTGAFFFIHGDRLDTPQIVTGSDQSIAWMAAYQPFGQTQILVNGLAQNLRFPGQYADAETGYDHNGFRDYDPTLGRYFESDPIGLRGGLNTYAYVGNQPTVSVDPLGLKADIDMFNPVEFKQYGTMERYQDPPDTIIVGGHGDRNGAIWRREIDWSDPQHPSVSWKPVPISELVKRIKDTEKWKKGVRRVKLFICWVGRGNTLEQIQKSLGPGATVTGPTEAVISNPITNTTGDLPLAKPPDGPYGYYRTVP